MIFKFKIEYLVDNEWRHDIIEFDYIPIFVEKALQLGATKYFVKELIKET